MKKNISKQINKNISTLVRVDAELHRLLKIEAATEKTTIKALLEGAISEVLSVEDKAFSGTKIS